MQRRKALIAWIVGVGLIALVLAGVLVSAAITAAILVDRVPGGDVGLASTPALDGAYATMTWSLAALVVVAALGVSVPLIARRVSRRPSFR
ncbi:hypothetical protein [Microbacterium sp. 11MF]|uniref:hypothetical protein n=1 Tax=Microbacterium sp. 11MF TaxID=1169146 RepID=UPI0003702068|nr:hypothetical protein [Microbacterium sp. 11MF]